MLRKLRSGALGRCAVIYAAGSACYGMLEILFRGFTHWTMVVTGGFCLLWIYLADRGMPRMKLWLRCLAGSLMITLTELAVGCVVNIALGWNVWDYSGRRFNFLGQICPLFTALWFLLCIPGIFLCRLLCGGNRDKSANNAKIKVPRAPKRGISIDNPSAR